MQGVFHAFERGDVGLGAGASSSVSVRFGGTHVADGNRSTTHCNTLQHNATSCNMLHTASRCDTPGDGGGGGEGGVAFKMRAEKVPGEPTIKRDTVGEKNEIARERAAVLKPPGKTPGKTPRKTGYV